MPILIAKSISAIATKRLDMTGVVLHLEVKVKSTIIVKSCTAVIFFGKSQSFRQTEKITAKYIVPLDLIRIDCYLALFFQEM